MSIFVLAKIESKELIFDLRKQIQQIQADLNQLGDPISEIPELISSANLLRANEYLSKANDKKTELLSVYSQYSSSLENILSSVFEIQNDLKEILKHQSSIISKSKKRSKTKTKSRITKR